LDVSEGDIGIRAGNLNICPEARRRLKFWTALKFLRQAPISASLHVGGKPPTTRTQHWRNTAVRIPRSIVAVATTLIALALPASALADQPNHVVVLNVTPEVTCERLVLDVTMTYSIVADVIYTDALCGFAAPLSSRKARDVASDPRVQSVTEESRYTGG
jgi:hypothetical protein